MQTLQEKIENIRYILLDMDGTMFNAAHRLDAETAGVMQQLMDKGYYVAAATGRGLSTLQPILNPLNFRFNAPSVGSTGGEVGEAGCTGSERLFTHAFAREELLQLLRFVLGVGANFCTDGIRRVFVNEAAGTDTYQYKDSRLAQQLGCDYPEVVQLRTETLEQQLDEGEVFKILIWHENDEQRDAIF
ncbi:MAG: HAD hydrolase family protein, partial [Oscillospiraceae bacterium]|nr:HAD hydrolase family protein [Oscillospiraceae bacterium]